MKESIAVHKLKDDGEFEHSCKELHPLPVAHFDHLRQNAAKFIQEILSMIQRLPVLASTLGILLSLASISASANTIQCVNTSTGLKMSARMLSDTAAADIVVGHDGSMESLGSLTGQAPAERNSPCGPGLYAYKAGQLETSVLICLPNYLVSRGYEHFQGMIAYHSIDPRVVECSLVKTDLL